jgi:hypothetical protein
VKYVLSSYTRFCSLCFGTSVRLVSFQDGQFKEEFTYSVGSRHWEGGVTYDSLQKIITVDYFLDDLTSYCNCNQEAIEKGEWTEEERTIFNYNCNFSFVFNGNNFEKVEGTLKKTIDEEKELTEIMSFKIAKNQKEVKLLVYEGSTLFYVFLKPDELVEFSYPIIVDESKGFRINNKENKLTFNRGNIVYQIYEIREQRERVDVGILVTVGSKTYDLKGDPESLKGTLSNVKLDTYDNVNIE